MEAETEQPPDSETASKKQNERENRSFPMTMAVFSALLLFVSAIQAWSFITSQRSFVIVTNTDFVNLGEAKPFRLNVIFQNSGKSTAIIDKFSITYRFRLKEKPDYDDNGSIASGPLVAGGKQSSTTRFRIKEGGEPVVTGEAAEAIKSGKLPFYVFGYVSYHDDYSVRRLGLLVRKTGFCYVFVPDEAKDGQNGFQNCPNVDYTYAY